MASDDLIFLSGMQPDTTDGDIKEQMRGALKNVDAALAEMGEDQSSIFVIHIAETGQGTTASMPRQLQTMLRLELSLERSL